IVRRKIFSFWKIFMEELIYLLKIQTFLLIIMYQVRNLFSFILKKGIVVACLGKDVSGEFEVTDFAFYGGTAPSPLPQINDDLYVAFISGLSVGNPKYKHL